MRNKINKSFSPKSANPPFCCFYAKEFLEKVALENNFLFTANPLLEKIMLTNLYLFQNDYRMIIENIIQKIFGDFVIFKKGCVANFFLTFSLVTRRAPKIFILSFVPILDTYM